MDKPYINFNKIDINNSDQKFKDYNQNIIKMPNESKINIINFNSKKRKRDMHYSNSNFEKKMLSFEDFTNKIRKELKFHKIKGSQLFNKNNINFFNDNKTNSKKNNSFLLIENNLNVNNNSNNIEHNNLNNSNDIDYSHKSIDNDNNIKYNNFIYQTGKKINVNNKDNTDNTDNYISSSKQRLLVTVSNSKGKNHNININKNEIKNTDDNIIINDMNIIPSYKNGKKQIKQICIGLISGITIIGFVYFIAKENQKNEIKNALSCFSITSWIIVLCFILVIIIVILLYYKNKEVKIFNNISREDFEILKKLLYENYLGNREEYIGLFQNQFINDCSNKRNLSEGKYIKYILPLINALIKQFNEKNNANKIINNNNQNDIESNFIIDESDIIISGQTMKIWRYINRTNI